MHSLPRYLALALFVVLAALVGLLAMPVWRGLKPEPGATATAPTASVPSSIASTAGSGPGAAPANRIRILPDRIALALAVVAGALAVMLTVSLTLRPPRTTESQAPFAVAQRDMEALTHLAQSSAAQHEELSRERSVRRRAEQDADLKQQLLSQSHEEKVRIGRDLHDGIIQSLYAVGLTLESVRAIVRTDPAEADRRLQQMRTQLNATIRDVRAYITGLAPDQLRRAGFAQAIEATLQELGAGRAVQFDVKIDDSAAALLSSEQSVETLQIAREAVSNALRHGGASLITLRLHQGDREVCLLVQDNGVGFDASRRRSGGHGLTNMDARAIRVGATLRIVSRPGEGARVLATLPVLNSLSL